MPRELPPPTTITPDDLWVICRGSPRNPKAVVTIDGFNAAKAEPFLVLTSKKQAQDLSRCMRTHWDVRAFVLPLTEFLVRRYDKT